MDKTHLTGRLLEKELFIEATPERVFQALTKKEDLERWFVQKAEVDLRVGGSIRFDWGQGAVETGRIVALEPPRRISYIWEAIEPSPTTITFDLTPENNGTLLRLSHTGIGDGENWDNYYTSISSGWSTHCKNLITWLETGASIQPGPTGTLHEG